MSDDLLLFDPPADGGEDTLATYAQRAYLGTGLPKANTQCEGFIADCIADLVSVVGNEVAVLHVQDLIPEARYVKA